MDNFLERPLDSPALLVDWLMALQPYQENHRASNDSHRILEELICVRSALLWIWTPRSILDSMSADQKEEKKKRERCINSMDTMNKVYSLYPVQRWTTITFHFNENPAKVNPLASAAYPMQFNVIPIYVGPHFHHIHADNIHIHEIYWFILDEHYRYMYFSYLFLCFR